MQMPSFPPRWSWLAITVMLASCSSLLASTASASAQNFTWSGGGEAAFTADSWSNSENWSGGAAPPASSSIGTLTFPALTSGACTASPPTDVCYLSQNDVSNLSVNSIAIDSGMPYVINGNPMTLGSGGITATYAAATPALPSLNVPLTLAAPQTWSINGGWLSVGQVTGNTDALNIDTSSGATLALAFGDGEVGSVAVTGANPGDTGTAAEDNGVLDVGVAGAKDGLNGIDGQPVNLTDAGLVANYASTVGPLSSTGGSVAVSEGATLTVNGGVTLDAASVLDLIINQASTTPGTEYSQLKATGTINLANASLSLSGGGSGLCSVLHPGDVYTLVTTTGSLSGTFASIPTGSVVPLNCTPGEPATVRIDYTAHAVTATVVVQPSAISDPSGGGGSTTNSTPSTGGPGTSSRSGGAAPVATISSAQVLASLKQQLIPSGKSAKIGALLKGGGLAMPFTALAAGTLTVGWYYLPAGATLAKHSKAKPVLVASGKLVFTTSGTGRVKIRLTAAGKRLLVERAAGVRLTANGSFVAMGGAAVSTMDTVRLRR